MTNNIWAVVWSLMHVRAQKVHLCRGITHHQNVKVGVKLVVHSNEEGESSINGAG